MKKPLYLRVFSWFALALIAAPFARLIPQGDLGGASRKTVKLLLEPGDGYTVGTTGKVKISILAGQ